MQAVAFVVNFHFASLERYVQVLFHVFHLQHKHVSSVLLYLTAMMILLLRQVDIHEQYLKPSMKKYLLNENRNVMRIVVVCW